mgnify:CR=1 FL=1|jgi:cupin fold WbuC family metalloprotein
MIIIDEQLLDEISVEASENNRLRKNFNLHNSFDDKVQRLLNAMEPGTEVPIHRHLNTVETYFVIRGSLIVSIYDDMKKPVRTVTLNPTNGKYGVTIPVGEWHSVEVIDKGTVIFEVKEGPYIPITEENILK